MHMNQAELEDSIRITKAIIQERNTDSAWTTWTVRQPFKVNLQTTRSQLIKDLKIP